MAKIIRAINGPVLVSIDGKRSVTIPHEGFYGPLTDGDLKFLMGSGYFLALLRDRKLMIVDSMVNSAKPVVAAKQVIPNEEKVTMKSFAEEAVELTAIPQPQVELEEPKKRKTRKLPKDQTQDQ